METFLDSMATEFRMKHQNEWSCALWMDSTTYLGSVEEFPTVHLVPTYQSLNDAVVSI